MMANDPSLFEGMWLGSELRGNRLEFEAASWEKTAKELIAKLDKANAVIIETAATRDAFRRLS
jgi:hypothetical protein